MRIAYIANPDIRIPVEGYGGLERQVQWLAEEMVRRGHQVTVFGNVPVRLGEVSSRSERTWSGFPISSQNDVLNHIREFQDFDLVHDRTKDHVLSRMTRLGNVLSTLVWSDQPARPATYVSNAVREYYGDHAAPVVPEAIPTSELPAAAPGDYYLSFGRIDPIKGTDLAVRIAAARGAKLVVAGHVGRWGDRYYAMVVEWMCRRMGYEFLPNPDNATARRLVANARGVIHTHRWLESFSEVVAEALCQGVPVLTTDTGAPQEWVRATDGGVVVRLADAEKGTATGPEAESFFGGPPAYDSTRRADIAARARALFDVAAIADQYERVYRGLAA